MVVDNVLLIPKRYSRRVLDHAGSAHGTITNAMLRTARSKDVPAGFVGRSLFLDGVNDILATTVTDVLPVGAMTVSCWIKPVGYGGGNAGRIFDDGKCQFWYGATNRLNFSSNDITIINSANSSITNNVWQHVLLTRAADGTATFYISGSASGTANNPSGTPTAGSRAFCIGNRPAFDRGFSGRIDELLVYDSVLSGEDIAALSANTAASVEPTHYWSMDR